MSGISLEMLLGNVHRSMDFHFVCLLVVAAVVCAVRLYRRTATHADWIAILVAGLSSGIIFTLHYCESSSIATFWRYHYPAYVVLMPFAAFLLARLCSGVRWRTALVALALAYVPLNDCRRMVKRSYKPARNQQAADAAAVRWAADFIRKDYRGPVRKHVRYTNIEYISDRRPNIYTHYQRIACEVGGRLVDSNPALRKIEGIPDYAFLAGGEEPLERQRLRALWPEIELVPLADRIIGRKRYFIYGCRLATGDRQR